MPPLKQLSAKRGSGWEWASEWVNEWMTAVALCIICNVNNYFVQSAVIHPSPWWSRPVPSSLGLHCPRTGRHIHTVLLFRRFWLHRSSSSRTRIKGWVGSRDPNLHKIQIRVCTLFVINKWHEMELQFNRRVTPVLHLSRCCNITGDGGPPASTTNNARINPLSTDKQQFSFFPWWVCERDMWAALSVEFNNEMIFFIFFAASCDSLQR